MLRDLRRQMLRRIRWISAALEVYDPKQFQDDEYDGDHDQKVNPTADFREPRADVPAEKSKQPKDYENYDDGPQHGIPPFKLSDFPEAAGPFGRVARTPSGSAG
jgi:hypothetical protein